ncbi:MAG TPA: hypothetical protein VFG04_02200 [Planctomycetaceae bacterium]|jgi:hypothetical protein|nr:hypothetical protein [Planctomycetaceae bacterium]
MKERTTQALLAAVVALLGMQLLRGTGVPLVQGSPNEQIPDVLRCRTLQIVDDHGRVRASIKLHPANPNLTMPNGKTQPEMVLLRLIDQNGRPSVKLSCSDQGAGLMVGGESDPTYARLSADLGQTAVTFVNKDGRKKVLEP